MTAVLETPSRPAYSEPTPAQVMRDSAEALADPALIDAVEEFLAIHEAASQAWVRVRLTGAGSSAFEDEAERLSGEATVAWMKIVVARSRQRLFVADEVLEIGADYYVGRHRFAGHPVVASGPVDWSQGRGVAA